MTFQILPILFSPDFPHRYTYRWLHLSFVYLHSSLMDSSVKNALHFPLHRNKCYQSFKIWYQNQTVHELPCFHLWKKPSSSFLQLILCFPYGPRNVKFLLHYNLICRFSLFRLLETGLPISPCHGCLLRSGTWAVNWMASHLNTVVLRVVSQYGKML